MFLLSRFQRIADIKPPPFLYSADIIAQNIYPRKMPAQIFTKSLSAPVYKEQYALVHRRYNFTLCICSCFPAASRFLLCLQQYSHLIYHKGRNPGHYALHHHDACRPPAAKLPFDGCDGRHAGGIEQAEGQKACGCHRRNRRCQSLCAAKQHRKSRYKRFPSP